jgi:hypothetical protein
MACGLTGPVLGSSRPAVPPRSGRPAEGAGGLVHCGGCARSYDLPAWLDLPLVGLLSGEAIAAHVVKWPQGVRIEVRRCARCGRPIARTGPPARP